jgi:hypothetical protein
MPAEVNHLEPYSITTSEAMIIRRSPIQTSKNNHFEKNKGLLKNSPSSRHLIYRRSIIVQPEMTMNGLLLSSREGGAQWPRPSSSRDDTNPAEKRSSVVRLRRILNGWIATARQPRRPPIALRPMIANRFYAHVPRSDR